MTDEKLAKDVYDAINAMCNAVKRAAAAGLQVTVIHLTETPQGQHRFQLFVGNCNLTAQVAKPILPRDTPALVV